MRPLRAIGYVSSVAKVAAAEIAIVADIDNHLLCRMPAGRAAALWATSRRVPPPPRATLVRWITKGVRGIRLNAERYGVRWFCRPADIVQFHARLSERRQGATS